MKLQHLYNEKININKKPLVSVLIATYNRKSYLEFALKSVQNQTYKNIEIIIADNNSNDDTKYFCTEESIQDTRIEYYRHENNIGALGNANFLLDKIKGEYFVFLNDDDWLSSDYIEKSIEFLTENSEFSFVSPSSVFYYDHFSYKQEGFVPNLTQDKVEDRLKSFFTSISQSILVHGCFRSSIITKWKTIDYELLKNRYAEDCIFMAVYLSAGKGKCLKSTHYNKIMVGGGTTKGIKETPLDYWNVKGLNNLNIPFYCSKIFSDAIRNDLIFKEFLSEQVIKNCSNLVIKIFYENFAQTRIKEYKKDFRNYIKRHPLFFTRRRFYLKLNKLKAYNYDMNRKLKYLSEGDYNG